MMHLQFLAQTGCQDLSWMDFPIYHTLERARDHAFCSVKALRIQDFGNKAAQKWKGSCTWPQIQSNPTLLCKFKEIRQPGDPLPAIWLEMGACWRGCGQTSLLGAVCLPSYPKPLINTSDNNRPFPNICKEGCGEYGSIQVNCYFCLMEDEGW